MAYHDKNSKTFQNWFQLPNKKNNIKHNQTYRIQQKLETKNQRKKSKYEMIYLKLKILWANFFFLQIVLAQYYMLANKICVLNQNF